MNKNVICFWVFMNFSFISVFASTYYVNVNGNNSNDGATENTAWKTISYATNQASSGDVVYVKAGRYENENIAFTNSGTKDSPIIIEGYQNIPGDNPKLNFQLGDELNSTVMPLLDGGNRSIGTAIDLNSKAYIEIINLQITNYQIAVLLSNSSNGGYNIVENVIATELGDINDSYDGVAFKIYRGGNNTLKNCIAINAAAEAISVENSDGNLIENCKVFCDDATNINSGTDYYIYVGGSDNIIKNCYIERIGNLQHDGHGIGVKGNGENNLFENCKAVNIAGGGFYVRHRGAKYNTFKNCVSIGGAGFMIRDGATYNKFYNCKTDNCYESIVFLDTSEDGGAQFAGRYNDFYNCLFENSNYTINFCQYNVNSDANDNRFINCVFSKGNYLFRSLRTNYNNEMINCIVSDISRYKSGESGEYDINFNFSYSDFWNNGFTTPSGNIIISENPLFIDTGNGGYHLNEASPCIDAGTSDTTDLNLPLYDASGNLRIFDGSGDGNAIIDIGVAEYNSSPVSVKEDETTILGEFLLSQNYPNPFNPSTIISFVLPKAENVKLFIYNMLGEKIAELVNENMSAGNHSVPFDASKFVSGIYIYRISAGQNVVTKKMMLLK